MRGEDRKQEAVLSSVLAREAGARAASVAGGCVMVDRILQEMSARFSRLYSAGWKKS
jgi:hypothetical protein